MTDDTTLKLIPPEISRSYNNKETQCSFKRKSKTFHILSSTSTVLWHSDPTDVFDTTAGQGAVYDRVGMPLVADLLQVPIINSFYRHLWMEFGLCTGSDCATIKITSLGSPWTSFTLSEMWEDSKSHFSSHHFPQGKNGLLFTYGVTGSGKTHTMQVLR